MLRVARASGREAAEITRASVIGNDFVALIPYNAGESYRKSPVILCAALQIAQRYLSLACDLRLRNRVVQLLLHTRFALLGDFKITLVALGDPSQFVPNRVLQLLHLVAKVYNS